MSELEQAIANHMKPGTVIHGLSEEPMTVLHLTDKRETVVCRAEGDPEKRYVKISVLADCVRQGAAGFAPPLNIPS